jgi:hypothetical protein
VASGKGTVCGSLGSSSGLSSEHRSMPKHGQSVLGSSEFLRLTLFYILASFVKAFSFSPAYMRAFIKALVSLAAVGTA